MYSITEDSYNAARLKYGPSIISGIEEAAEMCKIDPYTVYTFEELTKKVLDGYKSNKTLKLMVTAMTADIPGKTMLDSFGKMFRAANSVVYFKNRISDI